MEKQRKKYDRDYYLRHKEEIKRKHQKYYAEHKEVLKDYQKSYRDKNRDKILAYCREHYKQYEGNRKLKAIREAMKEAVV